MDDSSSMGKGFHNDHHCGNRLHRCDFLFFPGGIEVTASRKILLIAPLCALTLSSCSYLDAAEAVKERGKAYAAQLNDAWANDVADAARTVPAGALGRMPSGERKCALATLAGLRLVECNFVPAWQQAQAPAK
jgi:hypothetical protein